MSSFETRFYCTERAIWPRIQRNLSLLVWIAKVILAWFTQGRRLRKAGRHALREKRVLYLDDLIDSDKDD
jgi:hypothetical protein